MTIPATREDAIEALVASDVARWGEGEREASRRMHAGRTYGLAMSELANRAELAGAPDSALRAAADVVETTTISYEDERSAFERVRADARANGLAWDVEHPLRRFELAAGYAQIAASARRLAAYRLAGRPAPLGYYDDVLDCLHVAIEMLEAERAHDHGNADMCLTAPISMAMRVKR